jgi:4-hydroxy-2-oxoglutarate aldolase
MLQQLAGVFAPVSTPFAPDEAVDLDALRFNMSRYAQSGILGYLALGSNGENKSLTEDEKAEVLGTIIRNKAPRQVVMAGATYEAQRDTERFFRLAAGLGADFGLLLSPSYFRKQMTDEVLCRYFSTVADGAPLPILIYNAPGFCGVTLSPELVGKLARHPNIAGIKDSAATGIENFLVHRSETFHVLAGSVNFLFPAMMGGAVGGTISLANSFPQLSLDLFRYAAARDEVNGAAMQEKANRVNRAIAGRYGVAGVKAAMSLAGFHAGIPRRPLLPLSSRQVEELRAFLVEEGLLE